jgi:hypothetical protein
MAAGERRGAGEVVRVEPQVQREGARQLARRERGEIKREQLVEHRQDERLHPPREDAVRLPVRPVQTASGSRPRLDAAMADADVGRHAAACAHSSRRPA